MSKIGAESLANQDFSLYDDPPQNLCDLIFMDFVGGTTPRHVRTYVDDG